MPRSPARLTALSICRDKMRNRAVTRARLIATEACRAAANGAEFLQVIRDQVGIDLEIVDRETEADLAATGCTPLIDPEARGVVLFDIGGGSSELVLLAQSEPVRRGPPKPVVRSWVSLPVGVVTLAERHGGMRVDRALFEIMVAEVAVHAAPFTAVHAQRHRRRAHAGHVGNRDHHRRHPSRACRATTGAGSTAAG